MRFLTLHLKDKDGNLVDYMTGEKNLKGLLAKYEIVVSYLSKYGFTQIKENVSLPTKEGLEHATDSQAQHFCASCGSAMNYKEGISKAGKAYKGFFCPKDKAHEVQWLK